MQSGDFHLDIRIKVSNPTAFFKKLAKEKREQNINKVHFQVIDSVSNTENHFEWEVNEGRVENVVAQIWAQIRPKMRFLDDISRKNH